MSSRIREKDVTFYLELLNKAIGAPTEVFRRDAEGNYLRDADNRLIENPRTLCLDWAYGGVRLCSDAGAHNLSNRMSKREMYEMLNGMLNLIRHIDPSGEMRNGGDR